MHRVGGKSVLIDRDLVRSKWFVFHHEEELFFGGKIGVCEGAEKAVIEQHTHRADVLLLSSVWFKAFPSAINRTSSFSPVTGMPHVRRRGANTGCRQAADAALLAVRTPIKRSALVQPAPQRVQEGSETLQPSSSCLWCRYSRNCFSDPRSKAT